MTDDGMEVMVAGLKAQGDGGRDDRTEVMGWRLTKCSLRAEIQGILPPHVELKFFAIKITKKSQC